MRKCYEQIYEPLLIEVMKRDLPEFRLIDSGERRRVGRLVFYGPGKLTGFMWNPCNRLIFVIIFRVPTGKDSFEASCEWSESGKIVKDQPLLDSGLFDEPVLRLPFARVLMQSLSTAIGDLPKNRVISWQFWTPQVDLNDADLWMKAAIEDELRDLSEKETWDRVEKTVNAAVADVKRCALPWFKSKLSRYHGAI